MATYTGDITSASVFGGGGDDTFDFDDVVINGTSFQGGVGDDVVMGAISVGSSGVSFWSGAGNDSFSLGYVSNAAGTAYFWNESGKDTIVFDASAATNTNNFAFGASVSAAYEFNLAKEYTASFTNSGATSLFSLAEANTLATATFSATAVTLDFAHGTSLIFGGNAGMTSGFSSLGGLTVTAGAGVTVVANTINFGVASSTIPSFS